MVYNKRKTVHSFRCLAALAFAIVMLLLTACNSNGKHDKDPTGSVDTGADLSKIPDVTDVPKGDVTEDLGELPEISIVEGSMNITSAELLNLIRQGGLTANDDYTVCDGEDLILDRKNDKGKTYDLNGATIRIASRTQDAAFKVQADVTLKNANIVIYGGTAIRVDKDNATVTLEGLHFSGNAQTAVDLGGSESTVDGCTFVSDSKNVLTSAVVATGKNAMIANCNFQGLPTAVLDRSATGALIENDLFTDCTCAVSCETGGTMIRNNTIQGGTYGISAKDERSEISAGMGTVYNVLAAQNEIHGTATSILFENVSNCVALLNRAETISAIGCTNLYVNENSISGKLILQNNDYMIANENVYDSFDDRNNDHINGDNVTDIDARAAVGANEDLLPHINKEQFVGMKQYAEFRTKYGMLDLKTYIKKEVAEGKKTVLLPPGSHLVYSSILLEDMSDVKIYGYGVYTDFGDLRDHVWHLKQCSGVEIYGVFVGSTTPTCFQGTIIECGDNQLQSNGEMANLSTIKILPDPGYKQNSADTYHFKENAEGVVYKAGSTIPYSAFYAGSKSYDPSTLITTLVPKNNGIRGEIAVGDRITFRSGIGAKAIYVEYSSNVIFEDFTVFNAFGMAERDDDCDVAPVFHRYAVTTGAAPILQEGDYSRYGDLVWTDTYGRLRSAEPLESTQDATHSFNARVGIKLISCWLDGMFDDGGNIGASYGWVDSYDAQTNTLTYKTASVIGYHPLPENFRTGDTIRLYTASGKQLAIVTATSETVQTVFHDNDETAQRYTVKISADVTLDKNETVIIQNISASGSGFLWDNVKVSRNNSNGLRIKAPSGVVKNCSFVDLGLSGVSMVPEFGSWPECGPANGITIESNLFERCGLISSHYKTIWNASGRYSNITIAVEEVPQEQSVASDPNYCLHQNITIRGNTFRQYYVNNPIVVANVREVQIENNLFEGIASGENGKYAPILLKSGYDITIKGNTYPAGVTKFYENRNGWAENVSFAP